MKLIDESKNMKTRISRCDLLIDILNSLLKYEYKNIMVLNPPSSQLLLKYKNERHQIIIEEITKKVEETLAKAEIAATPRTSINQAQKALLIIRDGRQELGNHQVLNRLELRIKHFTHKTQLNGFLEAARKAEFKGQMKKAIDQYQEALFFLKNDEINDSKQQEIINKLETKISKLSEK